MTAAALSRVFQMEAKVATASVYLYPPGP